MLARPFTGRGWSSLSTASTGPSASTSAPPLRSVLAPKALRYASRSRWPNTNADIPQYDDEDTFVEELVLPTSGTLPQATGGAEPSRGLEEPAVMEEVEVGGGGFKAFAFPKRRRVPEEE